MNPTARGTARVALSAWGLFSGLLLMMLSNGLLSTAAGLRAEFEGFSTTTTGVVMAFYYVGFLAGARLVPHLVSTVGHIRVFAALASLASVSPLVQILDVSPPNWAAMRLVTGFAFAGLYITAESWLNDTATNENRGLLLSIYMLVIMGGLALGQALLPLADPSEPVLFVMSSVLVSAAVIPVTLAVRHAPEFRFPTQMAMGEIWRLAPLGVVTGVGVGIANGALWGLGAVYASRVGMTTERTALFLGAAVAGSLITQIPIGVISDRISRRWSIFLVTSAAAILGVLLPTVDPISPAMIWGTLLLGGLTFPMYSLGLSHINDRVPAGAAVAVSSLYVLVTGIGAIGGPVLAALGIEAFGPRGFFLTIGAAHGAIGIVALVRIAVREGLPLDKQARFLMVPARAGGVIIQLARNTRATNGRKRELTRSGGRQRRDR